MQITVFGASGKVGSLVVEEALRRGYKVIAFVHSHDLFTPNNQLVVVKGDIYEAADVANALRGSDAVLSCLGSWGTPKKDVLTAAMQALVPAMKAQQLTRVITLTGHGAKAPGETVGWVHRLILRIPIAGVGKVFADGEAHMRILSDSDLDWTTLRSPVMKNGRSSKYHLSLNSAGTLVNRAAVAAAMLDQLDDQRYSGKAPFLLQGR